MDGETGERGTAWLGYALQEGIKHGLTDAREILAHATPEVLVAQLPRDLTTLLIAGSLKTGRLTPQSVMEVAPPLILAEHLEANILWSCLSDAAEAANLVAAGGSASSAGRRWMGDILGRAITDGLMTPDDVVRNVPPAEWVRDAPSRTCVSEMLAAGLSKGSFDARLALEHLDAGGAGRAPVAAAGLEVHRRGVGQDLSISVTSTTTPPTRWPARRRR